MSDITDTLAPNSDQLDAVDLLTGPRTFTVERVVVNKSDQPVNVHLRDFPRVWRPGKNMRRVIASLWGADSATWAGKSVTLYCDKTVSMFGGETDRRHSHLAHEPHRRGAEGQHHPHPRQVGAVDREAPQGRARHAVRG
jgi:hypothetical protein